MKALSEKRVGYDWQIDMYTVITLVRFVDRFGVNLPMVVIDVHLLVSYLFDYQVWIIVMVLDNCIS